MNKNSVMTALLAIEIVTVLVVGIAVNTRGLNDYKELRHQIVTLQERITQMQKRTVDLEKQIKSKEEAVLLAAIASKVSRGVWDKRLQDCENKQNDWAKSACGTKCALYVELANKCINGINELSAMAKEK